MQTLSDIVIEKIKDIIFSGKYSPNTHLNIDEIAGLCQCSKTPVREALKKLTADGLVSYEPKIGFRVKYFTLSEYLKKYEIQELLEVYLIKKMAELSQSIDFKNICTLNNNIAMLIREKKLTQIGDANDRFHDALYEGYYNEFIVEDLKHIWMEVKMQRNFMFHHPSFVQNITKEHEGIINALKNSDSNAAEQAMIQHYKSGREAILFSQKW